MKKILFCILTVVCILTLSAGAKTPFLKFEFSHDADEGLKNGDVVECTVKYSEINDMGISSAEFVVEYSEGLEFNNDAVATGLEQGWALWKPNVDGNTVKFAVVDDTAVTPGKSDVEITFSFTVKSEKFSRQYVQLSENYIYDFDINEVKEYTSVVSDTAFFVSMPTVKIENAGASLRINKTPALRFGVNPEQIPEGVEYGIIVCESDKLDGELTLDSSSAVVLETNNKISDNLYCTDAFEIDSNTEKYTFRPFVKLEMASGGEYYLYFSALERSASDIASAELEIETDETVRKILKGFSSNA